ncbi:MAG: hypothetical protein IPM29_04650 [Planctomycetes bacterium]|nr:hypothetical protein [Planctomycetota bacterium]
MTDPIRDLAELVLASEPGEPLNDADRRAATEWLRSGNDRDRAAVVRALLGCHDPELRPLLASALRNDPSSDVRRLCALCALDDPDFPRDALVAAMRDADPGVRAAAVRVLPGTAADVIELRIRLDDVDAAVRVAAAARLEDLGRGAATPPALPRRLAERLRKLGAAFARVAERGVAAFVATAAEATERLRSVHRELVEELGDEFAFARLGAATLGGGDTTDEGEFVLPDVPIWYDDGDRHLDHTSVTVRGGRIRDEAGRSRLVGELIVADAQAAREVSGGWALVRVRGRTVGLIRLPAVSDAANGLTAPLDGELLGAGCGDAALPADRTIIELFHQDWATGR